MCFYWRNIATADKEKELNLDEIRKISRSFPRLLNLAVSGGEPFLRDDLDLICQAFYENSSARFMNIPTNGSLPDKVEFMTESILARCKKSMIAVELSVDGIGQGHDYIRGREGSFKNLEETYKRLIRLKKRHANLWLTIITTFSSYNQDSMEEIIRYLVSNMPVDDFHISLLHGKSREAEAQKVSLDKYRKALKFIETIRPKTSRGVAQKLFFSLKTEVRNEIIRANELGKMFSPCTALKKMIVIDEKGEVFPCETIRETLGNIRDFDYEISKVIQSRGRFDMEKKYKIGSGCQCNWSCAIFNNILYDPRRIPAIVKNAFKKSP